MGGNVMGDQGGVLAVDGPARSARKTLAVLVVLVVVASVMPLGIPAARGLAEPTLIVEELVTGLDIPWDLDFLPGGEMIFTERPGRLKILANGTVSTLTADFSTLKVRRTSGLLSVAVDPDFTNNRRVYTCQGDTSDVMRVYAWTLNDPPTAATRIDAPLVQIPAGEPWYHTGCRLRIDAAGSLWVGTGDNYQVGTAQDLTSLNGKILRVDRFSGEGNSSNPFFSSTDASQRKIFTYGHRNVQGLAFRPGTSEVWSVEHGPDADDEINLLVP